MAKTVPHAGSQTWQSKNHPDDTGFEGMKGLGKAVGVLALCGKAGVSLETQEKLPGKVQQRTQHFEDKSTMG